MKKKICYSDKFQKNYRYELVEAKGKKYHPDFKPELTPAEMLKLGVFGGAYFVGIKGLIPSDLPKAWFKSLKLSPNEKKDFKYNYFNVGASQSLAIWKQKGWINKDDPHGWFQWYCRYYLGRRHPDDERQIKRWKAFKRHYSAVKNNCGKKDLKCRPKQRQALLHWAYDSRKI
jgi:hypothetical protein